MRKEFLFLSVSALLAASCSNNKASFSEEQFLGKWHEVMPVNQHFVQGVDLQKGGQAESIGMATLKYDSWKLQQAGGGCDIILTGESIGNGQTIRFSDTLRVISLQNDTLTLGKGDMYRIQYTKADAQPGLIGGSDAAKGYTYSKVLDKKIRIFEAGMPVLSATDPQATLAGYVVFPQDSSKAELFLPEETVVLERRTRPDGTAVWNVEDDDTYMLEKQAREWLVTRRGQVLYVSTGCSNVIKTEFAGEGGETFTASFFTQAGVAQIAYQGVNHVLYQYRTASGYGYKNPFVDIRGKGKEVTLTDLATGKTCQFSEKNK